MPTRLPRPLLLALAALLVLGGGLGVSIAADGGRTAEATRVGDPNPILSTADNHACVLYPSGSLACWGVNSHGQLGDGNGAFGVASATPVLANPPVGRTFAAVSGTLASTCAILDDGSLACWGRGSNGELGIGTTPSNSLTPVFPSLPAGRTAVAINGGEAMFCAVLDDGGVSCWGTLFNLGFTANILQSLVPIGISLPAGRTATDVRVGGGAACALLDDGSLACWGYNDAGQLGDGTTTNSPSAAVPVLLPVGRTATDVSVGKDAVCALLDDGTAVCWGRERYGEFGDGAPTASVQPAPVEFQVPSGRSVVDISRGGDEVCVLLDDGAVLCGGRDVEFWSPTHPAQNTVAPVELVLPTGATPVRVGVMSSGVCVQFDDDQVTCVGRGESGQLGHGVRLPQTLPVETQFSDVFVTTLLDLSAPTLALPAADVVMDNDPGRASAVVTFSVSAQDPGLGSGAATPVSPTCTPASGSPFLLGPTTVSCSAVDPFGNTVTGSFQVRVNDVEDPVLTPPTSTRFELAPGAADGPVGFSLPTAADNSGSAGPVTCDPAPGAMFAPGDHIVDCSATDGAGNTGMTRFGLTVVAVAAPATTAPATTAPATTAPATTTPATTIAPTTTIAPAPAIDPVGNLPATGRDGAWAILSIALLFLAVGALARRVARTP